MAVRTFCDNIIKAYTHCDSVMSIYTYGELVWPTGPVPPGQWYVSWMPSNISGSFTMFGQTYRLEDYSGLYTWEGPASTSGMIGGSFRESSMYGEGYKTYMETNVLSIGNAAFQFNYHLESISCSRCRHIGENAFRACYSLQYVSLPRCLDIDTRAFMYDSSISYVSLPVVKSIGYGAFEECSNLHSLYAPRCEYISQHAFENADLYSVDLPMCSYIENDVFWGNHNLSYVSLPVCTQIDGSAFAYCSALTSVYLPVCSWPRAAFVGCISLESIDLPACTSTVETFRDCTSLSQVSLPLCEYVGYDTFRNCENLSRVELPECKSMSYGVFAGCSALSYIDLGECSSIIDLGSSLTSFKGAFQDCVNLTTVILRGSSVCRLGPTDGYSYVLHAFQNTPIASCSGSIYVQPILLGDYKTRREWVALACAFRSYYVEPGSYYISWSPALSSGSFRVDGHTCLFEDFPTHFDWMSEAVTSSMFYGNSLIENIDTNCYEVGEYAFAGCINLSYANLPECKYVGGYAFQSCSSLSQVSLSLCESIKGEAFQYCSSLKSIELPLCSILEGNVFKNCTSLSQVSLPLCESIGYSAFRSCSYLTSIELPVCSDIGMYAFQGCRRLSKVTLGYSGVVYIDSTTFNNTAATLSVYVPASLVDAYKSNYFWSVYSSRIFPIE